MNRKSSEEPLSWYSGFHLLEKVLWSYSDPYRPTEPRFRAVAVVPSRPNKRHNVWNMSTCGRIYSDVIPSHRS